MTGTSMTGTSGAEQCSISTEGTTKVLVNELELIGRSSSIVIG